MSLPTLFALRIGDLAAGCPVVLEPDEARHLKALRLRAGDRVRVTDGAGVAAIAELAGGGSGETACVLLDWLPTLPVPPVVLAFGVANKERTLWLVEKAVELGVRELHPVEFERSRSVADSARSDAFWKRARRRALAALKQSGGSYLPEIRPVTDLASWLECGNQVDHRLLASQTGTVSLDEWVRSRDWGGGLALLVGPEGGLTPGEADLCAAAGLAAVRLGPRTLRFETAAVAALTVLALQHDTSGLCDPDSTQGRPGPWRSHE